ncbi:MAG: hypothetical protein WCR54_06920 [Clostridia bacterium]
MKRKVKFSNIIFIFLAVILVTAFCSVETNKNNIAFADEPIFNYSFYLFEIDSQVKYDDFVTNVGQTNDFTGKVVSIKGTFNAGGVAMFGSTFNGTFQGNSNIINNPGSLFFGTSIGSNATISNLTFTNYTGTGNCLANSSQGSISKLFVNGTLSAGNDLLDTNNGTLTNVVNHTGGICNTNTATINTSIGYDDLATPIAINNNLQLANTDYYTLMDSGYNFIDNFSYDVGDSIMNCPSLRIGGGSYKDWLNLYTVKVFSYTYDPTKQYTTSSIVNKIIESTADFSSILWEFNGTSYTQDYIKNAGIYKIYFVYLGTDNYLPSKYTQNVTINKAVWSQGINFASGEFDAISTTYNGIDIAVSEPTPINMAEFIFSYQIKHNGIVSTVNDTGTYVQTITATSDNYSNITKSRNISVTPIAINISLSNLSIDYNQNANLSLSTISIDSVLVGKDIGKTFEQLKLTGNYTTNYNLGNNIGTYTIGYGATFLNYNLNQVTPGVLTVNPIDLLQGGIVFENLNCVYSGSDYIISATNIPDGISVVYENNLHKNAGSYIASATFSCPNYNNLGLNATLDISQKAFSITANSLTLLYDNGRSEIPTSSFGYTVNGIVASETALLNTLIFNYQIKSEGNVISVFDVGSYDIILNVTGTLPNYAMTINNGSLVINPSSMTSLYAGKSDKTEEYDGTNKTYNITFFDENSTSTSINYTYYINETIVNEMLEVGDYKIEALVTKINDNYLDTTYIYYLHITKINIAISFDSANYYLTYNADNQIDSSRYTFVGTLPDGLIANFDVKQNGLDVATTSAVGTYQISYYVAQSTNYNSKLISANVIIQPKAVSLTVTQNYEYNGNSIVPIITTIVGNLNNELSQSNFSLVYYKGESVVTLLTTAGSYFVEPSLVGNLNYSYASSKYPISITKKEVNVDLKKLEFIYGKTGEFSYGGIDYTIYSGGNIVRKHYYIADTNVYIDLQYKISSDSAATYEIISINPTVNYNFTVSDACKFNQENRVIILRATLSALWNYESNNVVGNTSYITYLGLDQINKFSFEIVGFVDAIRQSDCNITMLENTNKTIKNVGEYDLKLILLNQSNYKLDGLLLHIVMGKASLEIKLANIVIFQGESFVGGNCTLNNVKGEDAGKTIYQLSGANVTTQTNYRTTLPANTSGIYYTYVASFDNYTPIVTNGTIKIEYNNKRIFTFTDKTFVYDGIYHELKVNESQEEIDSANVVITYSDNNRQLNVGTYQVTATVHYNINDSEEIYNRSLKIIAATPIITLIDKKLPYKENYLLPNSIIAGTAMVNNKNIEGKFEFVNNSQIIIGKKEYSVRFVPTDSINYESVVDEVEYVGVEINLSSFNISDYSIFSYRGGNDIVIDNAVFLTLREGLIDGLTIYKNHIVYDKILLNKTEAVTISIKLDNQVVYENTFDVVLVSDEELETGNKITEKDFSITEGMGFSGEFIYATAGGGRIGLSDAALEKYELFINGNKVTSTYVVNGNETTLVIVVRDAESNATVFAEEYEVKKENVPLIDNGDDRLKTIWTIIGSVSGGIVLLVVGVFVVINIVKNKRIGK